MEQKLHQVADSIRFASYGYSGVFDAVKIDEDKLDKLYSFDIALAESVSAVQETAERLKAAPDQASATGPLEALEQQVISFDNKLQERMALFR